MLIFIATRTIDCITGEKESSGSREDESSAGDAGSQEAAGDGLRAEATRTREGKGRGRSSERSRKGGKTGSTQ